MTKINRNFIILLLFFIVMLVTISNCTKPECTASSDCTSSKICTISQCESKKCVYTLQANCCGNRINDSIEDGKPGNQCTCPVDYGKCEGKGKIKVGSRTEDAIYAHYFCNADNKCVLGVEDKDLTPQNFLDIMSIGFFKASTVIRYNKPFDVSNDMFEFKITLDDAGKDLVLPVKFTNIKLLYSSQYARTEQLIADKDLNNKELNNELKGIGDVVTTSVSLNLNYKPQELEEVGSIRYSIDYTYTKKVLSGRAADGTNLYTNEPESVRATFSAPAKQVFFVRSG